jgi:ribosome biogenesis GTPase / thiamine phosphate phosphatase
MDFTNLENLGFDKWFQDKLDSSKLDDFQLARVTTVYGENYAVTNGERDFIAEITGRIMFSAESSLDYPTVGDWCFVQQSDENSLAIIHEVFERKSILKRKRAGKTVEFQSIAANIDYALIVQSLDADYSIRRFERYLVMAREGRIQPVLLLSKSDLQTEAEIDEKKVEIRESNPDIKVVAFSNKKGTNLDEIEKLLVPGKTFCLIGSSGVGKTSLLNKLLGEDRFATRAIKQKDSKGKHTTTNRNLLKMENGSMIIDTPGMRELGNIAVEESINETFDDITELETLCKFSNCSHKQEKGCAILEALEEETISNERYQNYLKMLKESEQNQMSYLEKKEKNKKLGKLYKAVQKKNRNKKKL